MLKKFAAALLLISLTVSACSTRQADETAIESPVPVVFSEGAYVNEALGFALDWPENWREDVHALELLSDDAVHFYYDGESEASHLDGAIGLYLFTIASESYAKDNFGRDGKIELGNVGHTKFYASVPVECIVCPMEEASEAEPLSERGARERDLREVNAILTEKNDVLRAFVALR